MTTAVKEEIDIHCMSAGQLRKALELSPWQLWLFLDDDPPCIPGPDGLPPADHRDRRYDATVLIEWLNANPEGKTK